jgi:hypothetical protein
MQASGSAWPCCATALHRLKEGYSKSGKMNDDWHRIIKNNKRCNFFL